MTDARHGQGVVVGSTTSPSCTNGRAAGEDALRLLRRAARVAGRGIDGSGTRKG